MLIAGIAVTNEADKIASTDKRFDDISKVTGLEILKPLTPHFMAIISM